jgi:glycosyltransferase involved in cell wall biosynthesis
MNILLTNKFFYLKGGSERVLFQERDHLLKKGHKVIDFSMEDPMNLPSPNAASFVTHIDYQKTQGIRSKIQQAIQFVHSREAVDKLTDLISQECPDIAHIHNIYHQLSPAIIPVLKRHGIPMALTLHDSKLFCPGYLMLNKGNICMKCDGKHFWKPLFNHCQNSRMQEILLVIEAYWHKVMQSYDKVDIFLSPSHFMADLIGRRIPQDKIRILHNGIDTTAFVPQYHDKGYALYVGRISPEKGVETLLKAHASLKCRFPLNIIGTGPLIDQLRTTYPQAEFMGYQTGAALYNIIRDAAFVVVPSECHENCSMVVLEAMALGKPVIGSRVGGIPEQIEDGRTGLLFEMSNTKELSEKMHNLQASPSLRKELGKTARIKCEMEYSLATHCRDLIGIYERL